MITSVLKTSDKNARKKAQRTKNVAANIKYLVLNLCWKLSNQALLVSKLAGVLCSHHSYILKLKRIVSNIPAMGEMVSSIATRETKYY